MNFVLLRLGFLFHEKNDYIIRKLANYEPPTSTLNFLFVGTSRTDCGISPDDVIKPFQMAGIKANAINLGIDGSTAYTGLSLARKNLKMYDYLVVEIFPGDPLSLDFQKIEKTNPAKTFNDLLNYHFGKYLVLQNSYSIFLYCLNRNPIYRINCHDNGFVEIRHGNSNLAIQRAKQKWESFGERLVLSNQSFYDHNLQYCNFLKSILRHTKTKIIFLTMPVNGEVEEYQNVAFHRENIFYLLRRFFPEELLIQCNRNKMFSRFKTFEDSHIDNNIAQEFSFGLGTQLQIETLN